MPQRQRDDAGGDGRKQARRAERCSAEVVIGNRKGLHARASAQFVKCAERFDAEVRVTREGQTVLGTSIMGLMMLGAGVGHSIHIEAEGAEARAALDALVALIQGGFGETQ